MATAARVARILLKCILLVSRECVNCAKGWKLHPYTIVSTSILCFWN